MKKYLGTMLFGITAYDARMNCDVKVTKKKKGSTHLAESITMATVVAFTCIICGSACRVHTIVKYQRKGAVRSTVVGKMLVISVVDHSQASRGDWLL